MKLVLRNAYAALLNRLPDNWVIPIRAAYLDAPAGSTRKNALARLLKILRYKHPDRKMDSFIVPDYPDIRLLNVDSTIVRSLYWFGLRGYEGFEVEAWRYFSASATHVLELGANIGLYTIIGARTTRGNYVAVEPHPHVASILRRNLELNQIRNVSVVEAAATGQKSRGSMHLMTPIRDQDEAPTGSFLKDGSEVSKAARNSVLVPIVPVAELLTGVDLLKLDVEGYEHDILSACREYLVSNRPTIFVEVLPEAKHLHQLIRELINLGVYRLHVCHSDAVVEISPEELDCLKEKHRTRDVILLDTRRVLPLEDIAGSRPNTVIRQIETEPGL